MEDASAQLLLPVIEAAAPQMWLARHLPQAAITNWNAFVPYLGAALYVAVDAAVTCARVVTHLL